MIPIKPCCREQENNAFPRLVLIYCSCLGTCQFGNKSCSLFSGIGTTKICKRLPRKDLYEGLLHQTLHCGCVHEMLTMQELKTTAQRYHVAETETWWYCAVTRVITKLVYTSTKWLLSNDWAVRVSHRCGLYFTISPMKTSTKRDQKYYVNEFSC